MTNTNIETFFKSADYALLGAIRSVCRKKYEQTVKVLDGLSAQEWGAVKNGGLLSLPDNKQDSLKTAMLADDFKWSV